jgi:hypothetical protein
LHSMTTSDIVMLIEKPHVKVKLHERVLEVDLTAGFKKELEDIVEARPALRQTVGFLFQTIIPLDVLLRDIETTTLDERGRVKIVIPHRRDLVIPLTPDESKPFLVKLDWLIALERQRVRAEGEERRREFQAHQPGRKHLDQESLTSSDIQ